MANSNIFPSDCVSVTDIAEGERMINNFVLGVPRIYGEGFCVFNVHQLTHLPELVRRMGPLPFLSMFPFEAYNRVIVNSFRGFNNPCLQIAGNLNTALAIEDIRPRHTPATIKGKVPEPSDSSFVFAVYVFALHFSQ